jgi:hypothetical protein
MHCRRTSIAWRTSKMLRGEARYLAEVAVALLDDLTRGRRNL